MIDHTQTFFYLAGLGWAIRNADEFRNHYSTWVPSNADAESKWDTIRSYIDPHDFPGIDSKVQAELFLQGAADGLAKAGCEGECV